MPSRHYSAYILGIFPSIYDWAINVSRRSPAPAEDFSYSVTYPVGNDGFIGVLAWKNGSLLVSMVWVAMLVMILDRKWVGATVWAIIGSLFALFGIIHVPQAGFKTFNEPTYSQCWVTAVGEAPTCWEHAEQWMFFVGYIILAVHFAIIEICRRYMDKSLEGILDDRTSHAFDDWFADASKTQDEFERSKSMHTAAMRDSEVKQLEDLDSTEGIGVKRLDDLESSEEVNL
jgi:hypothetical protein